MTGSLAGRHRRNLRIAALIGSLFVVIALAGSFIPSTIQAAPSDLTILGPGAVSLDPAAQSDAGAAAMVSELFESLTAIDTSQRVQPALAQSWQSLDGGLRFVFHLRPNLAFSDGSPLRAQNVVTSWLRVLDPSRHQSLASLFDSVKGARDYRTGSGSASSVGIRATSDSDVEVQLSSPTSDLPAIVSTPLFAVVPDNPSFTPNPSFVASGGYVAAAGPPDGLTLKANSHYWAGTPAIGTINLKTSIGGKSAVDEFQAGHLDYADVSEADASWIAYDKGLGPMLRVTTSPWTEYYGFNTTKAPFDNVHVRRAFRMGIDWRRLVAIGRGTSIPATSMVPPGIPGRSSTDFGPVFDLQAAKSELAAAGYPNGSGFPHVTLVTIGGGFDAGIIAQLHDNLGVDIGYEQVAGNDYYQLLTDHPPAMWSTGWVADYPGADDFLGILLGTGKGDNYGRWSSSAFDSAISEALAATSPSAIQAAFDKAQAIVRDDAPVIPVDYPAGYALARTGLVGAAPNGQGIIRYAGLSWATSQ